MENISLLPDHLTECGRIYCFINQESVNFFIINCIACNTDYSEWRKFYNHFKHDHQLENIKLKQSDYRNKIKKHDLNLSSLEEKIQRNENLSEGDRSTEQLSKEIFCYKGDANILNKPTKKDEIFAQYLNDNYETSKDVLIHDNEVKAQKSTSSCFFRLYSTDPEIMLKFIELLRHHPCQWDSKSKKSSLNEKRFHSTLNLTKELNENLNINVTPKGTRTSILSLLRWFDREYIRYLNCQQNDFQFVSMHREYFDKLREYLPHQHLKPMTCDECLKQFKSEHLLMAHRHKYHNGQIPFRCRYCGHGFIHQSSHKIHENRHIKIHVWPCKICRYQATSKSDHIKHLKTHSSQQPHKCGICGLAYKTKTNLNVHLKSHSLPNYECEFCKKKFYEKYRYKRHIWQHEEQMSGKSVDNFTCEICGRRFSSNKTLIKHQLVHMQENLNIEIDTSNACQFTDVIVYFCCYCSLEFIYKNAYETHMNLRHGV